MKPIPANWIARAALGLISSGLFAAVLLRGGVYAAQWEWTALATALAALLTTSPAFAPGDPLPGDTAQWLMIVLLGWMTLSVLPFPPAVVALLSPERSSAVSAVRQLTGQSPRTWLALTVAPGATIERLLDVVPAMATFLVTRGLSAHWRRNPWIVVAPVVAVAWLESALGLLQFRATRTLPTAANAVTGTYVNRNHFAGLLEMAFPLAVLWAVALWRQSKAQGSGNSSKRALAVIACASTATCLLIAISLSLSRTGFLAALAAIALTTAALLLQRTRKRPKAHSTRWHWAAATALPACLIVFLPTRALLDRFGEMTAPGEISAQARAAIWRDTTYLIAAYKWTGTGLGAYEYAFYRFSAGSPMQTIDFAHNDYLQIIGELGFPGAALVAALALWIAWRLIPAVLASTPSPNWELAVALLAALLAISLHSLTDFNLYIPANALTLAWLSGIADSQCLRG